MNFEKTINQMLADVTRDYPKRDAIVHTEHGIRGNYVWLSLEIDKVARGFLAQKIQPRDKVAIWASNVPEWLIAMLALAKIGAITIPIDPAAEEENLNYILQQSETRALIIAGGDDIEKVIKIVDATKKKCPHLEKIISISNSSKPDILPWKDLITSGQDLEEKTLENVSKGVKPQDPVAIMYTSGTTGQPKGVVLDHLGLINKSMVATGRQGISFNDRLCLFFPLFHMFGNTCIALAGLLRGAALVMPCKTFEPSMVLPTIPDESCTAIYGSPSMLIALIDHPKFEINDWSTLTKGIIGGAPCPMELMRRIVEDIGVTDITVAYGITETSSWITMTHPNDDLELRVSTIGTALACNEVKIVDPTTGETLAHDIVGELCTRGFLMKEYYKMPGATASAIDREGWFHTGDLGVMDKNGYVKITGRLKDVIVRNGIEIYPVEVEETIYQLPEISEVQVFGFPDAKQEQEVAAWIKLKEDNQLSLDRISEHVSLQLPAEKVPTHYKIVTEFPMTGSGKVQKFKMAQMAEKEYM